MSSIYSHFPHFLHKSERSVKEISLFTRPPATLGEGEVTVPPHRPLNQAQRCAFRLHWYENVYTELMVEDSHIHTQVLFSCSISESL